MEIRLDTVKLKFSADIAEINEKYFTLSYDYITDQLLKTRHHIHPSYLKKHCHGINSVALINDRDFYIQISSKILKQNYPHLISKNNIEEVVSNLSDSGILIIKEIDRFVNEAEVLLCHVTTDIRLNESPNEYLSDIEICKKNPKYEFKSYFDETMMFLNNDITLKIYDKYLEVEKKKKRDLTFFKFSEKWNFKNSLRLEVELKSKAMVRSAFDFEPNRIVFLKDILESKINVIYNTYNSIIPKVETADPIDLRVEGTIQREKPSEKFFNKLGKIVYSNYYKNDEKQLRKILRRESAGNPTRIIKSIVEINDQIINQRLNFDFHRIEEIRNKIFSDSILDSFETKFSNN